MLIYLLSELFVACPLTLCCAAPPLLCMFPEINRNPCHGVVSEGWIRVIILLYHWPEIWGNCWLSAWSGACAQHCHPLCAFGTNSQKLLIITPFAFSLKTANPWDKQGHFTSSSSFLFSFTSPFSLRLVKTEDFEYLRHVQTLLSLLLCPWVCARP